MAERRFHSEISADERKFVEAMERAAQAAMTDAQKIQTQWRGTFVNIGNDAAASLTGLNAGFDRVKETIRNVRGVAAAAAGVIAGGAWLVGHVSATAAAAAETDRFARTLGITTEEASALKIALNDLEVDSASYTSMLSRMTVKLREKEERFNALGVVTRGANGELLNGQQIMQNALTTLLQFKEGTDRNLASTELFGRGWEDVSKLLRLTPEVMEQARIKAEELQTKIGPEGVERARAYRLALNDVKDMIEALWNRIGQALMPVLTDFSNWLSSFGPTAVTVLRGALGGLLTLFYAIENGIVIIVRSINATLFTVIEPIAGIAEAAFLALMGKFGAAAARLKEIPANIGEVWNKEFEEMLKNTDMMRERIAALFDPNIEQGKTPPGGGGGRTWTPEPEKADKTKSRMAAWQTMWDVIRSAQDNALLEMTEAEQRFWENIIENEKLSVEERIAITRKLFEMKKSQQKAEYDAQVAALANEMALETQSLERKQAIAVQLQELAVKTYGAESKEALKAHNEVIKIWTQRAEEMRRIEGEMNQRAIRHGQAQMALERQNMDFLVQMGRMSARERLAVDSGLIQEDYQRRRAALEEHLQWTGQLTQQEKLKIQGEIEALDADHTLQMQKNQQDQALAVKGYWENLLSPIQNVISTTTQGLILGTTTWKQAFQNLGVAMLASFIDFLAKILFRWIATQLAMTTFEQTQDAARAASRGIQAITDVATAKVVALSEISAYAATAGAASMASAAAIPFYGWAIAPGVGAANYALAMGFAPLAIAEKGFDVPRGMMPVTQLHGGEMVLPEKYADVVRALADRGGVAGGGGNMTVNIKAWDGRSVEQMFLKHGTALGRGIENHVRNFGMITVP